MTSVAIVATRRLKLFRGRSRRRQRCGLLPPWSADNQRLCHIFVIVIAVSSDAAARRLLGVTRPGMFGTGPIGDTYAVFICGASVTSLAEHHLGRGFGLARRIICCIQRGSPTGVAKDVR